MSNETELNEIELSLEAAKAHVDLAKSLAKLKKNADFKKLFLNKYLNSYAVRLVLLKASMGMQAEEQQLNIVNQLNGIGQMNQYMMYVEQEGRMAEKAISDFEEDRATILEEG